VSSVEREAAEWAVRMRGTPTEADREAFERWYAKAGNAEAFAMSEDDVALARTGSRSRIEAKAGSERNAAGGLRWAVATIAAVGIALAFAWHMNRQTDTPQIATGPMLPGQLRLADGSTVMLMDGAWAEPQFSESERRIRLHGGRAKFDVAHDSARPSALYSRSTRGRTFPRSSCCAVRSRFASVARRRPSVSRLARAPKCQGPAPASFPR
jgi:transmembrane sensor